MPSFPILEHNLLPLSVLPNSTSLHGHRKCLVNTNLLCPSCGAANMGSLPNAEETTEQLLKVITPYRCPNCRRTFQSGPFQISKAIPKLKRHD